MKIIKETLFFLWELPQNIIGLLVILWNLLINNGVKRKTKENISFFTVNYLYDSGVSLGRFINRGLRNKMSYSDRMTEYYNWYCEKWADRLGKIIEDRKKYIAEYSVYGTVNKSSRT